MINCVYVKKQLDDDLTSHWWTVNFYEPQIYNKKFIYGNKMQTFFASICMQNAHKNVVGIYVVGS